MLFSGSDSESEDDVYELDGDVIVLSPMQRFLSFLDDTPHWRNCDPSDLLDAFKESDYAALSQEQIHAIEVATRGQSLNPTWIAMRTGLCGSSIFKRIFTRVISLITKQGQDPSKLLKAIMGESPFSEDNVPASIDFGKVNEGKARKMYAEYEKSKHKGLNVMECGLFLSNQYPFCGSSPDGIAVCECHDPWLIEIKCSLSHNKNSTPKQAAKGYGCEEINGVWRLQEDHMYHYQIQGQLALTKKEKCVLVIYTNGKILPVEVQYNPKFVKKMFHNIEVFVRKFLVPHIVEVAT